MSGNCERCGRPVAYEHKRYGKTHHVVKSAVKYAMYGCDSGCDGHAVVGWDCKGNQAYYKFVFAHPYDEDIKTWAESLADEHLPGVEFNWEASDVLESRW